MATDITLGRGRFDPAWGTAVPCDGNRKEPMSITCTFVDWHDDMYPEFAPEPIAVPCRNDATHLLRGVDESAQAPYHFDLVVCPVHLALFDDEDLALSTVTELTAHFVLGWLRGTGEAELVELDDHQVSVIVNMTVADADLAPRNPLSGEWAGESLVELGLDSQEAQDDYAMGFEIGWNYVLENRAGDQYRLEADQERADRELDAEIERQELDKECDRLNRQRY